MASPIDFKLNSLFKYNFIYCDIWFELKFFAEILGFLGFAGPVLTSICLNRKPFFSISKLRLGLQLYLVWIIIFLICRKLTTSCLWSGIIIHYQKMTSIPYHSASKYLKFSRSIKPPSWENGLGKLIDRNTSIDARYREGLHSQASRMHFEITHNHSSISQVSYQTNVKSWPPSAPHTVSFVGRVTDRSHFRKNVEVSRQNFVNSHVSLPSQVVYCNIFMCLLIGLICFVKMVLKYLSTYENPTKFLQLRRESLFILGNCLALKIVRKNAISFNSGKTWVADNEFYSTCKFPSRPWLTQAISFRKEMVTFTQLKSHEGSFLC